MRRLFILLFCNLFIISLTSAYSEARNLSDYKLIYQSELATIDAQDYGKAQADSIYLSALEESKGIAKKNIDIAAVEKIIAEQKRFREHRDLATGIPAVYPKLIQIAQVKYQEALKAVDFKRNSKVLALQESYVRNLEILARGLINREKLAEAREVKGEIDKIKFEKGDIASKTKKPVSKEDALKQGLVLHYDFKKNEGSKVSDKSGSGNDGKVNGATWKMLSDGRKGVMDFDGKNDWIRVIDNASLDLQDGFTIATWVHLKGSPPRKEYAIISKGKYPRYNFRLFVGDTPNIATFTSKFTAIIHNHETPKDTWVFYVGTFANGVLRIYVNDANTSTVSDLPASVVQNDNYLVIGKYEFNDAYSFSGQLDEVMIYKRALSPLEIQHLYKATGGK